MQHSPLNSSTDFNEFKQLNKIVVLYGGQTEREISIQSAQAVIAAIEKIKRENGLNFAISGFDWHPNNPIKNLLDLQVDIVFIVLHGGDGENGVIQGFLQSAGIAYTGSGVLASSLAMNKLISKKLWQANGLTCPKSIAISQNTIKNLQQKNEKNNFYQKLVNQLNLPLIIKPTCGGSSLGVSLVKKADQIEAALKQAIGYSQADESILVEQYIQGKELTVSFLHNQALAITEIEVKNDFYDYDAKYISDYTKLICPALIDENMAKKVIQVATKAYRVLGLFGWGRVDLILDDHNQAYLIEVNTVPGMTSHSLVPSAAKQSGISFDQLVYQILLTSQIKR